MSTELLVKRGLMTEQPMLSKHVFQYFETKGLFFPRAQADYSINAKMPFWSQWSFVVHTYICSENAVCKHDLLYVCMLVG